MKNFNVYAYNNSLFDCNMNELKRIESEWEKDRERERERGKLQETIMILQYVYYIKFINYYYYMYIK